MVEFEYETVENVRNNIAGAALKIFAKEARDGKMDWPARAKEAGSPQFWAASGNEIERLVKELHARQKTMWVEARDE